MSNTLHSEISMTRIFLVLVSVFMASCLGLFDDQVAGSSTDESSGVLTGKVVSESGGPVAEVKARLLVLNKESVTGEDGVFSLKVPAEKPAAGFSKKAAGAVDTLVLSYKGQRFFLKPLLSLAGELGSLVMASKEIQGNIKCFNADNAKRLVAEFNPAEPADKLHAEVALQFDQQTGDFSGTVYYHYTSDTQAYILNITAYTEDGHIAFSNYMLTFRHDTQAEQKGTLKYPENSGVCDTCQRVPNPGTASNIAIWGSGPKALEAPGGNVIAITIGSQFIYGLKDDGTVVAWSESGYVRTTGTHPNLTNVKAIAVPNTGLIALKEDGTVEVLGYDENVPADLADVTAIASNRDLVFAIKSNGTVVAWDSSYNDPFPPKELANVKDIAAGHEFAIALKEDGTVEAWGYEGRLAPPEGLANVKAIAAGNYHFLALKEDGTVVTWGYSSYGSPPAIPLGIANVKAIAAGDGFSLALKEDGTIVAWGDSSQGQLDIPEGLANVKAIAARGYQAIALTSSPIHQNPIPFTGISPPQQPHSCDGCENALSSVRLPVHSNMVSWGSKQTMELENAKDIAAGDHFTIVLKGDGSVMGWGTNSYGQAGLPATRYTSDRQTKAMPAGLTGIQAVAAGRAHTVALKEDGTVVAWGRKLDGQCDVPADLTNVKAIGAGEFHSVALKEDGTVAAWGGIRKSKVAEVPTGLANVKAIASGRWHVVALKEDGTVVSWGNTSEVPDDLSGVTAIAAGYGYSVALKMDGTVVMWGSLTNSEIQEPPGLKNIKAIAAGHENSMLAIKEDGTVVTWGYYRFGQTATLPQLANAQAFAIGYDHIAVIQADGALSEWGISSEKVFAGKNTFKAIAAGKTHTLALKEDGTVMAWGSPAVRLPEGLTGIQSIFAVDDESVALKQDGSSITWGRESGIFHGHVNIKTVAIGENHIVALKNDGTLIGSSLGGSYFTDISTSPSRAPAGLANIKAISAAGHQTVALREDGTVVAWGYNYCGPNRYDCSPTTVPAGLTHVKEIAAGKGFIVALKEDGKVVAWGSNDYGETRIPVGLSNVKAIAVGNAFTVVLREDGTITAWGRNDYGQCAVPPGLANVKTISVGPYHTLALKEGGTVAAWGKNSHGQCVIPSGLVNVFAIAAGENHSVALFER